MADLDFIFSALGELESDLILDFNDSIFLLEDVSLHLKLIEMDSNIFRS